MKIRTPQSGFTLIEMIVSLAVFSGVITIAIGALLVLVAANDQLQGEQSVMTNLSFALDSMTREIRTGTEYHCRSANNYNQYGNDNMFEDGNNLDTIYASGAADRSGTRDCSGPEVSGAGYLHGISFKEGGDSVSGTDDRIAYFFEEGTGQLFRRVGTGNKVSIVSSGIYIQSADFFVTGSDPLSPPANDQDQASVTIFIEASASSTSPASEWYQLQTTITQRTLDI